MFQPLKDEFTRRRALAMTSLAFAGIIVLASRKGRDSDRVSSGPDEPVTIVLFDDDGHRIGPARLAKIARSNAQWRKQLSMEQYYVTRQQGTDTAFTGTYYQIHRDGLFRCICCDNALFSAQAKFDSDTGWPSFWAPIAEENIGTKSDFSMLVKRTEVHCARCDGHLGHLFNDGPEPTNLRYCINESSLRFIPSPA